MLRYLQMITWTRIPRLVLQVPDKAFCIAIAKSSRETIVVDKPAPNTETAPVSEEGVDLTLIRQLLAMSPTERAYALKSAANNLLEARELARRV